MEAGRELDALVAEKVMGWSRFVQADNTYIGLSVIYGWNDAQGRYKGMDGNVSHYSTDIAAAWTVVEAMRQRDYEFELFRRHRNHLGKPDPTWTKTQAIFRAEGRNRHYSSVQSADAHAICLAALEAVGKS